MDKNILTFTTGGAHSYKKGDHAVHYGVFRRRIFKVIKVTKETIVVFPTIDFFWRNPLFEFLKTIRA